MYAEVKPWCLVVGCGDAGAKWVARQSNSLNYLGLDIKVRTADPSRFVVGDLINLPFKNKTIARIQADFALNGLVHRDPGVEAICAKPEILNTAFFPEIVRDWYREIVQSSEKEKQSEKAAAEYVRRNVESVQKLLQISALREMWRVLKDSGEIEILDFDYIIDRLIHFAPHMLQENPRLVEINSLADTADDLDRSKSLQKVVFGSTRVQKIKLKKLPPYQAGLTL